MLRFRFAIIATALLFSSATSLEAKKTQEKADAEAQDSSPWSAETFAGLKFRNIGPALASGRIVDIAVHPEDHNTIYLAVAAGGVWKTENHGLTWKPIFDGEGSSSIGVVKLDPKNPNVVWVGTGENNSQRSVGYGDGVYKSLDGGTNWKHVGLEESEHIGMITIDSRDSDVVYVAAQGPLWSAGGDRGLYKTTDGGKSMDPKVLEISEAHRRQRPGGAASAKIRTCSTPPPTSGAGGCGHWSTAARKSAIWKSTDGGADLAPSFRDRPARAATSDASAWRSRRPTPTSIYAIVEGGARRHGGVLPLDRPRRDLGKDERATSRASGQYYQEIVADPHDVDRVYSNDTWMHVTEDGGKSFHQDAGRRDA